MMKLYIIAASHGVSLQPIIGDAPKQLIKIGKSTLLDRYLEIAKFLELEPVIITKPKFHNYFKDKARVMMDHDSTSAMDSIYFLRNFEDEDFCWIGGDMLFSRIEPLKEMLDIHREENNLATIPYARSERFIVKYLPGEGSPTILNRDPGYKFSIPTFYIHSHRIFPYIKDLPHEDFVNRAIAKNEKVQFIEYRDPVFEIDNIQDLNEAKKYFQ
jgi:NDP-sugar pyrophosphorylase family protein